MKYQSGETIMKGDRVLHAGKPATIDFVASNPNDPDPSIAWHVHDSGGGVMILDPAFGPMFIPHDQLADYEDLEFVARG